MATFFYKVARLQQFPQITSQWPPNCIQTHTSNSCDKWSLFLLYYDKPIYFDFTRRLNVLPYKVLYNHIPPILSQYKSVLDDKFKSLAACGDTIKPVWASIIVRSPLLGVFILRTTTYWGCESTVLRGSFESRGIQCFNVPYKENSRFFPYAGNWKSKNKYGGVRFVTDDIHFQFSQWLWLWYFTENTSENENENICTKASSDNSSSDSETKSNAKIEVRRSSTMPKTKPKPIWTGSSCHPLELIKLLKTIYKKWQPGSFQLFS